MKGAYKIEVRNKYVRYELTIKRNITIIRGDSGTGKTTLIKLIHSYDAANDEDEPSGVKLKCRKRCRVLHETDWEGALERIKDSIVFIDEARGFIQSHDFARAIANTDNYYVLITRNDVSTLPYSIHEIYELRSTGKAEKGESVLITADGEAFGNEIREGE